MIVLLLVCLGLVACLSHANIEVIYTHPGDRFAALEVRRYLYATGRTERLASLKFQSAALSFDAEHNVVLTRANNDHLSEINVVESLETEFVSSGHLVQSLTQLGNDNTVHLLLGNDQVTVLHSAYTFMERALGVTFQISGDILPAQRTEYESVLPFLQAKVETPVFEYRGLQPFHDFASGPDWWSADDYKAVASNLVKLKMNFIGFHTYPWSNMTNGTGPHGGQATNEPLVWVGTPDSLETDGSIKPTLPGAYQTSWANTGRGAWGMTPIESTAELPFGADQLFNRACYGSDVQPAESCPYPQTPQASAAVFEATSDLLRTAFQYARSLGVQTCVGTEMPLAKPWYDPSTPAPPIIDYYKGIFQRILSERGYDIDVYWLWSPEAWEWGKMEANSSDFQESLDSLSDALKAKDELNATFELATSGWVVGPLPDRSIFDKYLDERYIAIGSIEQHFGDYPVDPAYKNVTRHKKWVIPWLEDDPGLTAPQIWVNRTLMHMEDAFDYGITGLLGIHWRTGVTAPAISAMARKSWQFNLSSTAFWDDWALSNFGPTIAPSLSTIFQSIDSSSMPRPVGWNRGPGTLLPLRSECTSAATEYIFVDKLVSIQKQAMNLTPLEASRLNYWVESFLYMRAIARMECAWSQYAAAADIVANISDPVQRQNQAIQRLLPSRALLVANTTEMINHLLSHVSNMGEYGTVRNVLTQSWLPDINAIDKVLQTYLPKDTPIPALSHSYTGPCRLVVPTVRTHVLKNERLTLKAAFLESSSSKIQEPVVFYRTLGSTEAFNSTRLDRSGDLGNSYETQLDVSQPWAADGIEWYLQSTIEHGCDGLSAIFFPAQNAVQTVVIS